MISCIGECSGKQVATVLAWYLKGMSLSMIKFRIRVYEIAINLDILARSSAPNQYGQENRLLQMWNCVELIFIIC